MRFIAFSGMLSVLIMSATPCVSAPRSHHIPTLRHQPHQNEQTVVQQQATDVREVRNSFFSITLPEGWKL